MPSDRVYCMVTQYRLDGTDASTIHMVELANHLVAIGARVLVVCPYSRRSRRTLPLAAHLLQLPTLGQSVLAALTFQVGLAVTLLVLGCGKRLKCLYVRHSGLMLVPGIVGRLLRISVVLEVNGIVHEELPLSHVRRGFAVAACLVAPLERLSFRLASHCVAVVPSIKRVLVEEYGLSPSHVSIVGNGANVSRFHPMSVAQARRQIGLKEDFPVIGFVGNLQPWHGVTLLAESAPAVLSRLPEARFLIVGDGPARANTEHRARELGVQAHMIFTGAVPYAEVPVHVASCDVCAAPFPRDERNSKIGGSPLKVLEYAACGRPVVISSVLPIADEIARTGAGVVIPPNDPEALAEALVCILVDKAKAARMGACARAFATEQASWERTAEQVLAVLERNAG